MWHGFVLGQVYSCMSLTWIGTVWTVTGYQCMNCVRDFTLVCEAMYSHVHLLTGNRDAKLALTCASIAAAQLDPVVRVPHWARMPSRLERYWIRYTLASGKGNACCEALSV